MTCGIVGHDGERARAAVHRGAGSLHAPGHELRHVVCAEKAQRRHAQPPLGDAAGLVEGAARQRVPVLDQREPVDNRRCLAVSPASSHRHAAPIGAANRASACSPPWRTVKVTRRPGKPPRLLKSGEAVRAILDAGDVSAEASPVVLNCAIVARGQVNAPPGVLPGVKLSRPPG